MDEILFTPSALLSLLSKIDELRDYEVGVTETMDGNIQVTVGESVYEVDCSQVDEVEVTEEVVDRISDINEEAYSDLVESGEFEESEEIEAGLIKELVKTLAIGGLARLSGKVAKDLLK